jgi:hypothetical protein
MVVLYLADIHRALSVICRVGSTLWEERMGVYLSRLAGSILDRELENHRVGNRFSVGVEAWSTGDFEIVLVIVECGF